MVAWVGVVVVEVVEVGLGICFEGGALESAYCLLYPEILLMTDFMQTLPEEINLN